MYPINHPVNGNRVRTKLVCDSGVMGPYGCDLIFAMTPALSLLSCQFLKEAVQQQFSDTTAAPDTEFIVLMNKPNQFLADVHELFMKNIELVNGMVRCKLEHRDKLQKTAALLQARYPRVSALGLGGFCRGVLAERIVTATE